MAKNIVFEDGDNLSLPVIAGTLSGSPVIVGMLVGVAVTDRRSDGTATVKIGAVITAAVTATGNITAGQPIYITSATYALTDAGGVGEQLYGHAITTSTGAGSKTIQIRPADFAVSVDTPA